MKIDVEKCREVYSCLDLVGFHAGLLASQFIRLTYKNSKLEMNLTGLAIAEASCPVTDGPPETWTFYLDRRILSAFLTTTKAKTIELTYAKDSLTLKAGRQKAIIASTAPIVGYSSWKPTAETKKFPVSKALSAEFGVLADYAPITAAAEEFSAVHLVKGYGIIATDTFVLSACLDAKISETFPLPVIITKIAADGKGVSSLQMDKQGAGIQLSDGYVYQGLNPRCQSHYPIDRIRQAIAEAGKIQPYCSIPAKRLIEALEPIRSFIFGSEIDIMVEVSGKKGEEPRITLNSPSGQVHKTFREGKVFADQFSLKWPIAQVFPWVSHVSGLDGKLPIHCGYDPKRGNLLSTVRNKTKYLLSIAETV